MSDKAAAPGFLRVGVTGGIGSGKSTVCRLFQTLGRHVVWADLLAQTLADTDEGVKRKILRAFGPEAYDASGRLDRRRVGRIVFSNPDRLAALNAIVHPAVFREIEREIRTLTPIRQSPYIVIEAALIFETGFDARLDRTIVVHAAEHLRIARIVERDGLPENEIRRRMRSQMSATEKARRADFVIKNEGPLAELSARVSFLDRILSAMALQKTP